MTDLAKAISRLAEPLSLPDLLTAAERLAALRRVEAEDDLQSEAWYEAADAAAREAIEAIRRRLASVPAPALPDLADLPREVAREVDRWTSAIERGEEPDHCGFAWSGPGSHDAEVTEWECNLPRGHVGDYHVEDPRNGFYLASSATVVEEGRAVPTWVPTWTLSEILAVIHGDTGKFGKDGALARDSICVAFIESDKGGGEGALPETKPAESSP